MPATSDLPPQQVADAVAAVLRRRIAAGELRPGHPLRDGALAAEFDVSRNTARETLRLLAAEGLADHAMYRGFAVSTPAPSDIRDLYVVRRTLELQAIADSVRAGDDALARVEHEVAGAERAIAEERWGDVGTGSLGFHQALVALLSSPTLDRLFDTMLARIRLTLASQPDEADLQRVWVPRDRKICDLLLAGRRDDATGEMRLYLDDSERMIVDAVRALAAGSRRRRRRGGRGGRGGEHR